MVQRAEQRGLEEFEGVVEDIQFETGIEDRRQYHLIIDATSIEVGGATGKIHEWIPMSPKCTEEIVPQQSVMDRFLQQLEIVISAAKKANTVKDAFGLMKGKKFKFKRLKLGKDFEGHSAKEYIVPVALLE